MDIDGGLTVMVFSRRSPGESNPGHARHLVLLVQHQNRHLHRGDGGVGV